MRTSPCSWPFVETSCSAEEFATQEQQDSAKQAARDWLWNWTGRQYGICDSVITPIFDRDLLLSTWRGFSEQRVRFAAGGWHPVLFNGEILNLTRRHSSYGRFTAVQIPGPVHEVTSVVVDGEQLPLSHIRVDNRSTLVRTDGGRWPFRQDLTDPTVEVSYTRGIEVPSGGQIAGALLYCELLKSFVGAPDCQLPKRVSTVSREGVTMAVLDDMEGLLRGKTGIFLVDSWVGEVTARPKRSSVLSPDFLGPRRRTFDV